MGPISPVKKLLYSTIVFLAFTIFVSAPQIVEANREGWFWYWNDVIMEVHDLPPSTIALIQDPHRGSFPPPRYPFQGNTFQHSVSFQTEETLTEFLDTGKISKKLPWKELDWEHLEKKPDYIIIICGPWPPCEGTRAALRPMSW